VAARAPRAAGRDSDPRVESGSCRRFGDRYDVHVHPEPHISRVETAGFSDDRSLGSAGDSFHYAEGAALCRTNCNGDRKPRSAAGPGCHRRPPGRLGVFGPGSAWGAACGGACRPSIKNRAAAGGCRPAGCHKRPPSRFGVFGGSASGAAAPTERPLGEACRRSIKNRATAVGCRADRVAGRGRYGRLCFVPALGAAGCSAGLGGPRGRSRFAERRTTDRPGIAAIGPTPDRFTGTNRKDLKWPW